METMRSVQLAPSFVNWLFSGALIGLGVVVPGMSPSNFLIYLGLYQPMAFGIRHLNLSVIPPLALGGIVCVLLLARLISWLFKKFYALVYHLILGIVIGSTIAIIPEGLKGWSLAVSAVLFVVGGLISYALAKLDENYSRGDVPE
jgi:putative membrane protein